MACNYALGASIDDGSCDTLSCFGCTDITACNFDSTATQNDGSCAPSGCLEPDACNYSAEAECDDGSCDYACCPGPGCCLDGTVWDYTNLGCVVATPTDVDLDGCTGVGDVLEVLATFGQCYDDSENEEDGIGGDGFNPSNSIPESYYTDPEVLLLLDFEGDMMDHSPWYRSMNAFNYTLGTNRHGTPNSALTPILDSAIGGSFGCPDLYPETYLRLDSLLLISGDENEEYSISMWYETPENTPVDGGFISGSLAGAVVRKTPCSGCTTLCLYQSNLSIFADFFPEWDWTYGSIAPPIVGGTSSSPEINPEDIAFGGWHHLVMVKNGNGIQIYVDASLVADLSLLPDTNNPPSLSGSTYEYYGLDSIEVSLHDCAIEYFQGISDGQTIHAIDDVLVLNRALSESEIVTLFGPEETESLIGCLDSTACNFLPEAVFSSATCAYPSACADCAGNLVSDINNNGICDANDILVGCTDSLYNEFISTALFDDGSCTTPRVSIDGPCNNQFAIQYFGYSYNLVEIGPKCWFQEDLRTDYFLNGDAIQEDWIQEISLPDSSLGRLYTYYVVMDEREVCPSDWHIAHAGVYGCCADGDWDELETLASTEAVKHAELWNGSNQSGFSALPQFGSYEPGQYWENESVYASWHMDRNAYGSMANVQFLKTNSGWQEGGTSYSSLRAIRCVKD